MPCVVVAGGAGHRVVCVVKAKFQKAARPAVIEFGKKAGMSSVAVLHEARITVPISEDHPHQDGVAIVSVVVELNVKSAVPKLVVVVVTVMRVIVGDPPAIVHRV